MSDPFPFVNIPPEAETFIGKRVGNSHVYEKEGSQEELEAWWDALLTLTNDRFVSPGGVLMFCPVSRAAVHRRIKQGQLSAFTFHVTHRILYLFGAELLKTRESPYIYIPVSEAKAWKKELEARAIEQGRITEAEIVDSHPDWQDDFLRWHSKWHKKQEELAKIAEEVEAYKAIRMAKFGTKTTKSREEKK
jgi:hypothetical protein